MDERHSAAIICLSERADDERAVSSPKNNDAILAVGRNLAHRMATVADYASAMAGAGMRKAEATVAFTFDKTLAVVLVRRVLRVRLRLDVQKSKGQPINARHPLAGVPG